MVTGERCSPRGIRTPQVFQDFVPYFGLAAFNHRNLPVDQLRDAGFCYVRRFAVLPSLQDARWFIPIDAPRVSAAAFRMYTPYRMAARLGHTGVQTLGGSASILVPRRSVDSSAQHASDRTRSTAISSQVLRSAWLCLRGPSGRARKPTVALLDQRGDLLGFAKLAYSDGCAASRAPRGKRSPHACSYAKSVYPWFLVSCSTAKWKMPHVTVQQTAQGRARYPTSHTRSPSLLGQAAKR